tara:strand:+ start:202 stop:531 length:330 start_codon:yes stop_codon:yes gene_type:complete
MAGKLKMKLAFFLKKEFSFHEYSRHTLASSGDFVTLMMGGISRNNQLNRNVYFKTKNFYIQLLSAYSSSYIYYPFFMENIPVEILTESLKEMIEGRDAGVKAWSFITTQ